MSGALGGLETAFWGIVTFSILVVMHEMGHFLAARAFGVKVHEFMVGLPGPAIRIRTKNMAWGITAIPLGGYVRIAGMEPGDEDPLLGVALARVREAGPLNAAALAGALGIDEEHADRLLTTLEDWKAVVAKDEGLYAFEDGQARSLTDGLSPVELLDRARSVTYRGQSSLKKIAILAMGVVTNLVVAILTFTIVLSVWGYVDVEHPTTTIGSIGEASPALAAGLQKGDVLVALDGAPIDTWDEFQSRMAATDSGQVVTVTVQRGGQEKEIAATLEESDGHGYLGVGPTFPQVHLSVWDSLKESFRMTGLVLNAILDLFNPSTFSSTVGNLAGVVGISVMAAAAVESGPLDYAAFIAMLSLSLGLMNLIPLPPLDGGKIVLEIVERIIRRALPRAVTLGLSAAGMVLLLSLIAYVMYADIARLVG